MQKSGSWFSYGETRLGQGRENVVTLFKDNPALSAEIEKKVRDNADKLLPTPRGAKPKTEEIKPAAERPEPAAPAAKAANIDVEADDI